MWLRLVCSNMDLHQHVVPCGLLQYGFTPQCGSFWFVVTWIYDKMWFPLVCSNMVLHQNVVPFGL